MCNVYITLTVLIFVDVLLIINSLVLADHYSKVTIDIQQEPTHSKLILTQTEVPEAEIERTKQGWTRHIFSSLKYTFGFGVGTL